jgi:hypothetical protein
VTVTGRLVSKATGAGVAGLSVTLSGDATATAQTDAQGRFSFAGLKPGGAYTVIAAAPGWHFSPSSRTYLDCRSDRAADFEALIETDDAPMPEPLLGYVEVGGETCTNCDPAPASGSVSNLIDKGTYFVAYHYLDFLGRGPDTPGLNFWKGEVESCGADAVCREVKRVNVSAAFFLSIEFQETGYLVYRLGLTSFGQAPKYRRFVADSRRLATGVQVGIGAWRERLQQNRSEFARDWTQRAEFRARYDALGDEQYVAALVANAGLSADSGLAASLAAGLKGGTLSRADVLLAVADDEALRRRETNRAFVMMEYYGYLRRDPDASGYDFWLSKLEQFGGNYIAAEMVKAFLSSDEYRRRFAR